MERLRIRNLDELADHWQIPVDVVKYFITERGLDPTRTGKWLADETNAALLIAEKQKVFEAAVFPERFRTPTATSARTV